MQTGTWHASTPPKGLPPSPSHSPLRPHGSPWDSSLPHRAPQQHRSPSSVATSHICSLRVRALTSPVLHQPLSRTCVCQAGEEPPVCRWLCGTGGAGEAIKQTRCGAGSGWAWGQDQSRPLQRPLGPCDHHSFFFAVVRFRTASSVSPRLTPCKPSCGLGAHPAWGSARTLRRSDAPPQAGGLPPNAPFGR